jgi:DNA-binding response OmpR family regulator
VSRLLVVEDDETIGSVLQTSLRSHGYDVIWHRRGRDAVREAAENPFDLVLLDLGLPDLDGTEVCRQLRTDAPSTVIVMMTRRTEEIDVVVGLESGADDYLTKPMRLAELLARIRAHLRRGTAQSSAPSLTAGDLLLDTTSRRATVAGNEVVMRAKEFDLLARLLAEPGTAVTRETLMADVWDEHWFGSTKTLDVTVATLRRKLSETTGQGAVPRIVTVRGHGYRLEAPTPDSDDSEPLLQRRRPQ